MLAGEISDNQPTPERIQTILDPVVGQLQTGLGRIMLSGEEIEPELRLRESHCASVSLAIQKRLAEQGVESDAVTADLAELRRKFPRLSRNHTLVRVGNEHDPIIVDGTYGQFFRPFGLDTWLAHDIQRPDLYPAEQVLVFNQSAAADVALRMAETTSR